jgi:hypothetical protein
MLEYLLIVARYDQSCQPRSYFAGEAFDVVSPKLEHLVALVRILDAIVDFAHAADCVVQCSLILCL